MLHIIIIRASIRMKIGRKVIKTPDCEKVVCVPLDKQRPVRLAHGFSQADIQKYDSDCETTRLKCDPSRGEHSSGQPGDVVLGFMHHHRIHL